MKALLACIITVLCVASCAAPSPQGRIAKNGGMYSLLSPKHRELVASGQVAKGMSKDAVYLAWGTPSKVYKAEDQKGSKERWVYTRSKPTYTTSVGIGYGGYSRYGYCGSIYHSPRAVYIPEKVAEVVFIRDLVDSWERSH